jgi:hypothetical protein
VEITPDVVDCIVFWTKDASNLLPHLDELDDIGYKYYFQFTLTPYGDELEPGLRDKREIEDTFVALSERLGKNRVVWRYDPIVLNDTLDVLYQKTQFARMCEKLAKFIDTVTVSFVDMYAKLKTPLVREITAEETAELALFVGGTAREHGLRAVACCERDLSRYGIGRASCIDKARIEEICGYPLKLSADKNQRKGCGCCKSVDIGAYNTCPAGCVYCYANDSSASARRRYVSHNPEGELLTGVVRGGEEISDKTDVKRN